MMDERRAIVLKAFLSRCSPEKSRALSRFLPAKDQSMLESLPAFGEAEEKPLHSLLSEVHWSWYLPTLKSYPEREQQFFLEALGPHVGASLQQELTIASSKEPISPFALLFLQKLLLRTLIGEHEALVPKEYLPPSFLNALARLTKKELIRLIDYLALYDLAFETRQIVETKVLKKLSSFLDRDEKAFLKKAIGQKDPHPMGRMGLEKWDGTESLFRHLLHRRGLARLGVALSGQNPDLIWYICHQLDIGRGTALYKSCAKEAQPDASDWVCRQIEDLFANPEVHL